MKQKDHYRTLKIATNATQETVKKAYRKLVLQYHPDKNNVNVSVTLFHEVQEAYDILSDPQQRKLYDEQRYFAGLSTRKAPVAITMEWLLRLTEELKHHTGKLHTHDINHEALFQYTQLVLSEEHLIVFQQSEEDEKQKQFVENILCAIKKLHYSYHQQLMILIKRFVGFNDLLLSKVNAEIILVQKQKRESQWFPYLIIIIVLVLCLFMYWYGKRL